MTHVVVDDQFPDHPKAVGLSDAALACWLRGLCYASRYLTDGAIATAVLPKVGKPKAAAELVAAGLWEVTDGGWQIHDYSHLQRTRDEVMALSELKGNAGTLGNHKRWHTARNVVAPDCRWCRRDIAGATDQGSQTDHKRSPEAVAVAETERVTSPPATTRGAVDKPEGDQETTADRALAGANRWADDELRAARTTTIVHDAAAFRASKLAQVDLEQLERWAALYPTARPTDLATAISNPAHLRYLPRAADA